MTDIEGYIAFSLSIVNHEFITRISTQCLVQSSLKALISLLNIKGQLSRLFLTQFFRCPHLIQRNQPLDDLPAVLEFPVRHFINRLNDFRQ